jgi:hypothetical protein
MAGMRVTVEAPAVHVATRLGLLGTPGLVLKFNDHELNYYRILATEIAMLFLYLPFIIFEAWMLGPCKRNVGDLDEA